MHVCVKRETEKRTETLAHVHSFRSRCCRPMVRVEKELYTFKSVCPALFITHCINTVLHAQAGVCDSACENGVAAVAQSGGHMAH